MLSLALHRLYAVAQSDWDRCRYAVAGGLWPAWYLAFGSTHCQAVYIALLFIGLDFVTGILKAVYTGKGLCSAVALRGLARKAQMVLAIAFGHAIDQYLHTGDAVKLAFVAGVVSIEAVSVLENIAATDIAIPKPLKQTLLTLIAEREERSLAAIRAARAAKVGTEEEEPKS
jgi:toxin secretion/phage lysis holin